MNAIEQVIGALATGHAPQIVGIDGPAGSGKSTFAAELAVRTEAPVVGIDDFLGWTDLDPGGVTWWPRLEAEVLEPFVAGRTFAYRRRDWHGDPEGIGVLPELVPVEAGPLLILEGVGVSRRALADRLAVRVWVEAPTPERLARGIARDGEAQLPHWLRWQELESEFFALDGTRARADIVVVTG